MTVSPLYFNMHVPEETPWAGRRARKRRKQHFWNTWNKLFLELHILFQIFVPLNPREIFHKICCAKPIFAWFGPSLFARFWQVWKRSNFFPPLLLRTTKMKDIRSLMQNQKKNFSILQEEETERKFPGPPKSLTFRVDTNQSALNMSFFTGNNV